MTQISEYKNVNIAKYISLLHVQYLSSERNGGDHRLASQQFDWFALIQDDDYCVIAVQLAGSHSQFWVNFT